MISIHLSIAHHCWFFLSQLMFQTEGNLLEIERFFYLYLKFLRSPQWNFHKGNSRIHFGSSYKTVALCSFRAECKLNQIIPYCPDFRRLINNTLKYTQILVPRPRPGWIKNAFIFSSFIRGQNEKSVFLSNKIVERVGDDGIARRF